MRVLGEWSNARFKAERLSIERLLAGGNVQKAHAAAGRLLQRSLTAGETAYEGAAYDIAMAHCMLGRVLNSGGAAEAALSPLAEAERRFQALAEAGNTDAERMASVAISDAGIACSLWAGWTKRRQPAQRLSSALKNAMM